MGLWGFKRCDSPKFDPQITRKLSFSVCDADKSNVMNCQRSNEQE